MKLFTKIKSGWSSLFRPESVDPVRDEKKIFTVLLLGERAAVFVSAVVSGFAVAAWGWIFAGGYWDNLIFKSVIAVSLLIAATYFTDVAIRYIVQKGAYDFFMFWKFAWLKDFRSMWFERLMQTVSFAFLLAIGAGMTWFDYISVDAVRRPVADLVEKESNINQDSLRRVVDAQEQVRMNATIAAINAIQIDIRQTERQIAKTKTAVLNGDKGMKKLYDKGNGWAASQIQYRQNKATAGLNAQITTLRQNKAELEAQRTRDIAYRAKIIAVTDSSTLATNAAIASRNAEKVSSAENTMMYVGFYTKAGAMAIRILLVALFLALVRKDVNGDGQIDYADVTAAAKEGFRPA